MSELSARLPDGGTAAERLLLRGLASDQWQTGICNQFDLDGREPLHRHRGDGFAIRVEVRPAAASVECCIADNGESDTYVACEGGFSIVDALAAGLGGTVEMKSGPTGTITVVSFPYRW